MEVVTIGHTSLREIDYSLWKVVASQPPTNYQTAAGMIPQTSPGYAPIQQNITLSASQFPNQQGFLPGESLHQGTDPNSLELFKQNIQIAQDHVARIQSLARSTLAGIQNAYHPGSSPTQTETNIAALKQALTDFDTFMWQTGVGALPLLPLAEPNSPVIPPTEAQLMEDTNGSIQSLYERLKRSQDSAAVVTNLLGAPEAASRK